MMRLSNPWWVVVGAILGLIVGNGPVMQFSFGVFINALTSDFNTDRATISGALLLGFILTGLCTPIAGALTDRFGVRRVTLPAIAIFALMIGALGILSVSPTSFIVLYGITGIVAAGQTPLPYAKAVAGAFERRRGLALGVSMAGVGLGAVIVPQVAQLLLTSFGWRGAYLGLGAFTFLCAFPAALLLLKDPVPVRTERRQVPGLSPIDVLLSRNFWLMVVIFFVVAMAANGTIAHLVPMLTDRGIAPQLAATAISISGAALIAGRLIAGYLLDQIFAPFVAAALFLPPLAGICLLLLATTPTAIILAAAGVGIGLGAEIDLIAFLISRYFGMRSFGQIYGYLFAVFMLGAGLGPFLMGLSFSYTGAYTFALTVFAAGLALTVATAFIFGPYKYPVNASNGSGR